MRTPFTGCGTALVTPFRRDGALDEASVSRLAKRQIDAGVHFLVPCGTTGESPTLTDAEKTELWKSVAEAVTVPIIAGSGTYDTAHSIELTKTAEACGAAGILAVCPYYNRPSQAGIEAHFRAIAAATSLPVLLYDIPVRSGRKIATDTMLRLAREVANIVGVKDAAGDLAASARLVAEAPSSFEVYSGDDGVTLPLLAVGAVGTVGVATHWTGRLHGQMISAFAKGDVDEARRINATMLESFAFETGDDAPNPVPAKAMMRVLGLPVGQCRLPMGPAPDGLEDRARRVLANLGDAAPVAHG